MLFHGMLGPIMRQHPPYNAQIFLMCKCDVIHKNGSTCYMAKKTEKKNKF